MIQHMLKKKCFGKNPPTKPLSNTTLIKREDEFTILPQNEITGMFNSFPMTPNFKDHIE